MYNLIMCVIFHPLRRMLYRYRIKTRDIVWARGQRHMYIMLCTWNKYPCCRIHFALHLDLVPCRIYFPLRLEYRAGGVDQIYIKIPNPKWRLYWCLLEFLDWRYSQPCWYFRPLLWTSAPLSFSLIHLSPPPSPCVGVNKYRGKGIHTVCNRGGGDRGPQTDKHLPPSTFTGQFWCLRRYLIHGPWSWTADLNWWEV